MTELEVNLHFVKSIPFGYQIKGQLIGIVRHNSNRGSSSRSLSASNDGWINPECRGDNATNIHTLGI